MNKRVLHHFWTKIRPIRPWYFLALAILSLLVCLFAMRANNLHMVSLRSQVYQADKNNSDIEGALRALRSFVYGHMNTDLTSGANAVHPPIQLKYTYERLVTAQNAQIQQANSQIYTAAQRFCEAAIPSGFSGSYRISCIQSYVTTHGVIIRPIPKNLYEFDFISPRWSPDLAGWSLVAGLLLMVLAAVFWLVDLIIRRRLKHHL